MTLSIITRDITDQFGNLLEGATVTVRQGHGAGGSLAELFSDAAGDTAISNPVTVASGTLSVYAQPGRYRLEGTSSAGSGVSLVDTTPISGKQYLTRAEAEADIAAGYTAPNGTIFTADGLPYMFDNTAGNPIADMPGVVPGGSVHPEHFGAVGDGVADDSAAIVSWFALSRSGFPSEGTRGKTYRIATPILDNAGCNVDFNGATVFCDCGEYDEFDHEGTSASASSAQKENPTIVFSGSNKISNVTFRGDNLGGWTSGVWVEEGAYTATWHNVSFRDFGARGCSVGCDDFVCTGVLRLENVQNNPNLRPPPLSPTNYFQGGMRARSKRMDIEKIVCEVGYHRAISVGNSDREYFNCGEVFSSVWDGTLSGAQVFYTNLTQNVHVGRIVIKDYSVPVESQFGGAAIYCSRESTNVSCLDCHVTVTGGPEAARAFVLRGNRNVQLHGYFESPHVVGVIEGHRNDYDAFDIKVTGIFRSASPTPSSFSPMRIRGDSGSITRVTVSGVLESAKSSFSFTSRRGFIDINQQSGGTTGDIFLENLSLVFLNGDGNLLIWDQQAGRVFARGIRCVKPSANTGFCLAFRNNAERLELQDFVLGTGSDNQTVVWVTSIGNPDAFAIAQNGYIPLGRISLQVSGLTSRVVGVVTEDGSIVPNTANNINLSA